MTTKESRWRQRFSDFNRMFALLEDHVPPDTDNITPTQALAFIKAFELTYELAWNVLKGYLEDHAVKLKSRQEDLVNQFSERNLIPNQKVWLDMRKARNMTVHVYDLELVLQTIAKAQTVFIPALAQMQKTFAALE